MLADHTGDLGTEQVAGVLGNPSCIFILAREDAEGDGGPVKSYQGILGHYQVQTNKVDPGPAFQWDRLITGARDLTAQRRD